MAGSVRAVASETRVGGTGLKWPLGGAMAGLQRQMLPPPLFSAMSKGIQSYFAKYQMVGLAESVTWIVSTMSAEKDS